MVRIAAATISACPLLARASALRMKCIRQRCLAAPVSTVSMARVRPRWESEVTSCTPERPRSRSPCRKSVQKTSVSLSPTATPSTSRRPSAETLMAMTTARETTRPPTRALQ
jgi:hypothetical protein